jgi:RNA polymerase sigma-70 factor (ECF subfamily)
MKLALQVHHRCAASFRQHENTRGEERSDSKTAHAMRVALEESIPNLRAFGRSLCHNGAQTDDLVQETLLKAWQNRASFQAGSNLKAWLFTILRNTYVSELRKSKYETGDPEGMQAARLSTAAEQPGHMEVVDFQTAFAKLPSDQREAIILIGAEGFTYEEAARICGCAVGTVKSRVGRARGHLVELLGLRQ